MSETLIPITRFRDECDHATRGHDKRDVLTWDQLAAMLTNHARRVAKSGPGWAPVTFVDAPCTCGSPKCPGDRGHRINENVIALHALTLDVDKTTAVKASERRQLDQADAEQALNRLCELGLRHVAHTTHSHAYPDHASFRVTIALSRSVSAEEWPRFYAAAMAYLDIPHDPASRNTARFWYLPSCKPDAAPIVVVHDGQPLDVEMVMGISRAAAVAATRTAAKKPAATRRYVAKLGDLDIRGLMAERYAAVCAEPGRADVEAQWHIGLYCPWKDEHTSPDVPTATTVFLYKSGAWTFKCLHSHCEGRDERDFHKFHDPAWVPFDERPAPARRPTRREPPSVLEPRGDPSRDVETDAEVAAIRAEQLGDLAGANPPTSPTPLPPPPFPPTDDDLDDPSAEDFDRDEDNRIYHSQDNIALALRKLGVTVRYDMFADRDLIDGLAGFGPEIDDPAMNRLRLQVDSAFRFRISKDFFYDVIADQARDRRFHPVRDYLDALRWDGVPRLDTWLTSYAGAADTEYTRAVGRIVLVAAVRRVRQPGCKYDEMLILESEQGKHKSTALAVLAGNPEWFSDDLPLGDDTKRLMEATMGRWIVEAGELKGMSRGDVHELKGYLSRCTDAARMAYGRKRKLVPRQFIIIGTTNETTDYLKDSTGARRFWPVRIVEFDLARLRADRDQLWAEAAHCEAAGASIRLDPALYPVAAVEQEDRRSEDPMEVVIAKVFGEITGKIPTADAWLVLGIEGRALTPDEMIRFSAAMRRQGWHKSRNRLEAGQREYCYLKGDSTQREQWLGVSGKGEFAKLTPSSTEKSRGPTLVGRELRLELGGKQ